jgi:hypothetical protein
LNTLLVNINIDLKKIPKNVKIDDVLKLIYQKSNNQKYLMEIGDKVITLNENNRDKFRKAFDSNFVSEIETTDSWVGVSNSIGSASSIGLSSVGVGHSNQAWAGAFFKYTHLMDFDLSEFGIYKTTQNLKYDDIVIIFLSSLMFLETTFHRRQTKLQIEPGMMRLDSTSYL